MVRMVKNPPTMWETWVQSLGWEDPLKKGKATQVLQRVGHDFHFHFLWMASLIAQLAKNLPAMQETPVLFLSQEDPLEKG